MMVSFDSKFFPNFTLLIHTIVLMDHISPTFKKIGMNCISSIIHNPNSIKIIGSFTIPRTSSSTNDYQIPINNKPNTVSNPSVFATSTVFQ